MDDQIRSRRGVSQNNNFGSKKKSRRKKKKGTAEKEGKWLISINYVLLSVYSDFLLFTLNLPFYTEIHFVKSNLYFIDWENFQDKLHQKLYTLLTNLILMR